MNNNRTPNRTNYHSHCLYCDGHASMETFVQAAIASQFTSYGFSSHAPLPFSTRWAMEWSDMDNYLAEFQQLKAKYAPQIELYIALEIDYLNEQSNPSIDRFKALPLHYRIGSVHTLYNDAGELIDIDTSADKFAQLVDTHFKGDILHVVHLYYHRLLRMIALGGFDTVGHADKIHYNANCYRPGLLDEPWYQALIAHYFSQIAQGGYMVEINTKAYHTLGTFFPNERYFGLLKELGIRVQVNSDAHYPDRIDSGRPQALAALVRAGHSTVMELQGGVWTAVAIGL